MNRMALTTKLHNAPFFCLFYWFLSVGHLMLAHAEGLPNPKLLGVWPGYSRGPARAVDVSGNYIYAALAGGSLAVCEIIDETNLVRINTQDLVESAALQVVGNLAYVAAYGDGLKIFDVSNPTNLVQVG